MPIKPRSSKPSSKSTARLGAYLAAGVGASLVSTPAADSAIIGIDIGPSGFNIGGINAGIEAGGFATIENFPSSGEGTLRLWNGLYDYYWGMSSYGGLVFSSNGGTATPRNFASNTSIDTNANWDSAPGDVLFRVDQTASPAFGAGSYMGFRTNSGNYGWLEVLWNGTDEWEIVSGAFENVAGVAILAGDTGTAAVPEPSTFAMGALLSGGAAFVAWRKRRQKAAKKAA